MITNANYKVTVFIRFVFAVDGTVESLNSMRNSAVMFRKVFPDNYVGQNIRIFYPCIIPLNSAHNLIFNTLKFHRYRFCLIYQALLSPPCQKRILCAGGEGKLYRFAGSFSFKCPSIQGSAFEGTSDFAGIVKHTIVNLFKQSYFVLVSAAPIKYRANLPNSII